MDLTLRQLRMLRAVSERGTIAAAADTLGYTPSAVSQQLSAIEKTTGVAVLERAGRNVRLTDPGRELVRHADQLVAGMEAAQAAMERVGGAVQGELVVSVYDSVAATLLTPLLVRLAEDHPDLVLSTRQREPDDAVGELLAGDLDLAFLIDYSHLKAEPRDDIVRHDLLVDSFHLAVPADDPLTGPVDLADVADRPFVSTPPHESCGRCVVLACREAGFEPRIRHHLSEYRTSLPVVAAGQGVAVIPDLGLLEVPPGVKVLELRAPVSRTIQLAHRTSSSGRPAIDAVHHILRDVVRDLDLRAAP